MGALRCSCWEQTTQEEKLAAKQAQQKALAKYQTPQARLDSLNDLATTPMTVGNGQGTNGVPQLLAEGRGHSGHIRSLRFSPDGKQLLTAGADGTVVVFNLYKYINK